MCSCPHQLLESPLDEQSALETEGNLCWHLSWAEEGLDPGARNEALGWKLPGSAFPGTLSRSAPPVVE